MWKLFKGGNYSRKYGIPKRTESNNHWENLWSWQKSIQLSASPPVPLIILRYFLLLYFYWEALFIWESLVFLRQKLKSHEIYRTNFTSFLSIKVMKVGRYTFCDPLIQKILPNLFFCALKKVWLLSYFTSEDGYSWRELNL